MKKELWIARNKDGCLMLYRVESWRDYERELWTTRGDCLCCINRELFPEVTWESDPIRVKIIREDHGNE